MLTRPLVFAAAIMVSLLAAASAARAQESYPSAVAVDTVAAVDATLAEGGDTTTGITLDAMATVGLGKGMLLLTRPFLQRLGSGEWNAQLWVAAVRWERLGPISIRADAGYMPPPIGAANLLLRPHLNPTISQPSSLFTALPPLFPRAPRINLLGAVYPLGASVTASTLRWDVRVAAMDTSPLRARRVFADDSPPNPPRLPNVVFGGGITPIVGLRLGASVAHGRWTKAGESPAVTADRNATVVTVEGEFAFRYTKLLGEWVQDRIGTDAGTRVAHGFFIQGQQTLSPRWFVAGRVERISSPILPAGVPGTIRQHLNGVEEAVGYRLTPDLTIRVSHRARQLFGASEFGHSGSVSLVFWKRWF